MSEPTTEDRFVRYVAHLAVELPPATETIVEARQRLAAKFPRNATRRMTHLGLLLGSTMEGVAVTPDDAVVYASTYAETRALEDFLGSFPTASPALFQTSIHPSAVQQVLIGRQQATSRLWPLAGGARLFEQALLASMLEPASRVVVCGGEERGTWMLDHGFASDRSFAFAFVLTRQSEGAVAEIRYEASDVSGREPSPTLMAAAGALASRAPVRWRGPNGAFSISFPPP